MALIRIRSTHKDRIRVEIDGHDITESVAADPLPVVEVADVYRIGESRVMLTLVGEIDIEVDGAVEAH